MVQSWYTTMEMTLEFTGLALDTQQSECKFFEKK